jgi:phospholipid/cholesterol/gamma-HCH transport system permease protein
MEKETVIPLPENLDRNWVIASKLLQAKTQTLVLDFSQTNRLDSAAICAIRLMHALYAKKGKRLTLRNIQPSLLSALQTSPTSNLTTPTKTNRSMRGFFTEIGDALLSAKDTMVQALSVLTEMLYWGTIGALKRQDFRQGSLGEQMYQLGYKAFGIVGLLSFLVGMVLALQAAIQLKIYGAGVFLGPLIGITMVREMGPLLTAVILAGRTGSATAAEIGTMGVGEELDALRTMGVNPVQFVVVPKFWAITITMPVLSILSTAAGILGGYCIGLAYLDISSNLYWDGLSQALFFKDIAISITKSVVFSWLIIWIGAFYGFKVHGGAESVGRETTASVVACIFIIIIADALFSFAF